MICLASPILMVEAMFMYKLLNWWLKIPRPVRMGALAVFTTALVAYMLFVGGRSVLDDPNLDTLWLSVIGAALLTFIVYKTAKK